MLHDEDGTGGIRTTRLLSDLSGHGCRHLTEIETDLVQTNALLVEAVEKLSQSFLSIHRAITAQQEAVSALVAGNRTADDAAAALKAGQEEVGRWVAAAVTGLQFQDMTSQLIGRTVTRVVGLRDAVGAINSAMHAGGGADQAAAASGMVRQALCEQSAKLGDVLPRTVCQTHMDGGDIELF